jgi:hypothetical protein
MTPSAQECHDTQQQLLDTAPLTEERALHLRKCTDCRTFQKGLLLAPRLWDRQPLYHPALRMRTLARIDDAFGAPTPRFLPFLVLALSLAALASLVVPVWVLSEALTLFFESVTIRLGLSLFLAYALGGAAAGLCTVSLAARAARSRPGATSGGAL